MLTDKKDQIANALCEAADQVRNQPIHEHHAMVQAAGAGAMPPWLGTLLQTLLQTLGPAFAQAIQNWLNSVVPKPQPPTPGQS